VGFCENLGIEGKDSAASIAGTIAHEYCEKVLRGSMSIEEVPATDRLRDCVRIYVEECLSLVESGDVSLIEEKVKLPYSKEKGTCDFVAIKPDGSKITIRDYKNGRMLVEAFENHQLALYAWSFYEESKELFGFDESTEISIGIVQPRTSGSPVDVWETHVAELRPFIEEIMKAAEDINSGDASRVKFYASPEVCQWCPASQENKCAFKYNSVFDDLGGELDLREKDIADGLVLTDELIVRVFRNKKALSKIIKDCDKTVLQRALDGQSLDGTKLVMGRKGNRQWVDENEAIEFLAQLEGASDVAFTETKVVSPSRAEAFFATQLKKGLKDQFQSLVFRSEANPTVALADDKREAVDLSTISVDANTLFENLDQED